MEPIIVGLNGLKPYPTKEIYIKSIFERLDGLLPYKTGFSVSQIDVDPIYTQAKSYLNKIVTSTAHFQDIVASCTNIILKIITADDQKSIDLMKTNSINSLYIIVSLLFSFIKRVISTEIIQYPTSSLLKAAGLTSAPEFYSKMLYMSKSSSKLDDKLISNLLLLIGHLKSDQECITILKSQCEVQIHLDPGRASHTILDELRVLRRIQNDSPNPNKTILSKIDTSLTEILMYISMNNDDIFLDYLNKIFKRLNVESLYIRRMSILKTAHLRASNFMSYLKLYKNVFNVTKRASQQALLMYYFSLSVSNWATYRTNDFYHALHDLSISSIAEALFDSIYKQFDGKIYTKSHFQILSCLLYFQPKQLEKFLEDKNSKTTSQLIKRSMGKINPVLTGNVKQRFLVDFINLIQKSPESAETLTTFLLIGCAVEAINKNHILAKFLHSQFEHLCVELQMNKPEYIIHSNTFANLNINTAGNDANVSVSSINTSSTESSTQSSSTINSTRLSIDSGQVGVRELFEKCIERLRVHAFAILCMVDSHDVIDRTIQIFGSLDSSFSMLATLSGGIKLLISIPLLLKKIFPYLQNATPVLIRYLRIAATRLSSQQKLELSTVNTASYNDQQNQSYSQDVPAKVLDNMGVWAGPSSTSTPSASAISRNNAHLKTQSQGSLAGKVKNVLKAHSTASSTITEKPSDPSSFAASLNSRLGTLSHHSSIREEDNLSFRSHDSLTSSDYDEPELFRICDESTLPLSSLQYIPSSKLKLRKYPFTTKEIRLQHKIMINIMDTYMAFPFLCYAVVEDYPNSDFPKFESHFKRLIDPIATLLVDSDMELVSSVKNFLLSFCQSVANKVVLRVFVAYIGTSILVDSVAKVCLTPAVKDKERDSIIKFILQLLEARSENSNLTTLYENKHVIESVHAAGTCGIIIKNFERCIFLGLFSNNLDTIRTSRRLLSFWIFVVTNPHHHASCFDKSNLELAKKIAADKMTASSLAIKKKLRDHLCQLKEPTDVLLDVWSLMFEKLSLVHGYSDMPQGVKRKELQNYLPPNSLGEISVYGEYMASIGGLIMSPKFHDDMRQPFLQNRLELFLNYKMLNLFNSDVKQRENCREILCVSVHPYLCGLIIELIKKYSITFEVCLKNKEYNICETFLSVLRTQCSVDFNALFPHAVALWRINFQILQMININDNDLSFLRLKLKFCKLQVLFLSRLEELAMNGNILKKNEYARVAAEYLEFSFNFDKEAETDLKPLFSWNENPDIKVNNKLQELKKSELRDLHLDIKVEISMMLKLIFYKLPLDTPKNAGKDNPSASAVSFSNYFNLFVRLLEKLNEEDSEEQPLATRHRYSNIIRDIIQSLVNLLVANPDTGLKYALPLGYHMDNLIRVSFINVFSSIVKELRSTYYKKDISLIYGGILEVLVVDEPLLIATAGTCPKAEIDTFANALMEVNEDETNQLRMMMTLIRYDIINTTEKNEIMRSNTVGTRLVSLYSGIKATDYLVGLYKPIFEELLKTGEFFEIEKIDKMTHTEKETNIKNFLKYFHKITDTICNSINEMPAGLKLISKTIFDATSQQLYESRYTALSSYLFLRLFNPAIVSPERIGIIKTPDIRFKRSLIQLARTIQVIVNEKPIKFSLIEHQQEVFGEVKKQIWSFMQNVVSIDVDNEIRNIVNINTTTNITVISPKKDNTMNCGIYFHNFFYDNWLQIREDYTSNSGRQLPIEEKVKLVSDIDNTIGLLGLPMRMKGFVIPEYIREDKSEKGILMYDFLSQSALTEANDNTVKVLVTKDGMPLLVINTLDIDEDCTVKSIAYAFLQILVKYWLSPYCVLWDLTSFDNIELFKECLSFLEAIVSPKYWEHFKRVYMLNTSPAFFEGFKAMELTPTMCIPDYYFITSDDDIKTWNKYGLINYVNSVSNDARVSFRDVSLYQILVNRFVPVKLKVGNHFVQINSGMPKQLKIGNKMHVIHLVDFYRIKYLEEINASVFTGVSNEISMIDTRSQSRVIISSPKKIEIMRTLYYSRARLNNNDYQVDDEKNIGFSPTLSIGQLLNISFTGLLSSFDDIRNASYALLASISSTMNMDSGRTVDYVNGIIFPYGDSDYISTVSANFAKRYPEYTYAFLSGFFQSFDNASTSNKDFVVLYASPWIVNIYKHVYLSDIVRGRSRATNLIRKIVRISKAVDNRQSFALFIWPQLSIEDNLIDILIDEIVAAAIDHEAEGNPWKDITMNWPLRPTIKICHVLIERLKYKSYETKNDETEIETHTRWVETTVLVNFLAYLIFDSLLFVERYISDIFFIVTIYMDYGPMELRRSLLKLLNRAFHSYLSKPMLSREHHNIVEQNIALMNSARFKLLFGLTREDSGQPSQLTRKITGTDIVNKSHSIASLCEIFTSFLKDFSDKEEYELQLIKWQSYVMKITFNNILSFQPRAILVLGNLTQQGMSGNIVCKVLKLVETSSSLFLLSESGSNEDRLKLCICTLHSFGQSMEGVLENSIFHPLLFWVSYSLMFVENVYFVQYASKYLRITFKKMCEYLKDKDISVVDYLFEKRVVFEPHIQEFEKMFGVFVTPENFDLILTSLLGKGLESPFSIQETIETIKIFVKYRFIETKKFPERYNEDNYCPYLFYVYMLAGSNEEMIKILDFCGMSDIKLHTGIKGILIPEPAAKFPAKRSLSFYSACELVAKYFKMQKVDELICNRLVALYVEAFKYDSFSLMSVFANNEILLLKILNESSKSTLMEYLLDLLTRMMSMPEYSKLRESPLNTPIFEGMEGLNNLRFNTIDPSNESTYTVSKEIMMKRYELVLEMVNEVNEVYSKEVR